jgi:hypothetical protein
MLTQQGSMQHLPQQGRPPSSHETPAATTKQSVRGIISNTVTDYHSTFSCGWVILKEKLFQCSSSMFMSSRVKT